MESKIIHLINNYLPDTSAIYLFGSYATGQQNEESDIDIAVLTPKPIDKLKLFEISTQMAITLNKEIDLIDLKSVYLDFQFEIISTGRLIFSTDQQQVLEYEMIVMSMYQRFNEERRELLEEIGNSGRILS